MIVTSTKNIWHVRTLHLHVSICIVQFYERGKRSLNFVCEIECLSNLTMEERETECSEKFSPTQCATVGRNGVYARIIMMHGVPAVITIITGARNRLLFCCYSFCLVLWMNAVNQMLYHLFYEWKLICVSRIAVDYTVMNDKSTARLFWY